MTLNSITRKGLHDKLWNTRITKLSTEFEIKDYTLRKVCEEHEIPRPKSGYWTKLKFDKNPPIAKLTGESNTVIDLAEYRLQEKSTVQFRVSELTQILKDEYQKEFIVPQKLRNRHPLVKRLKAELMRKGEYDGLLHSRGSEHLYVTVSKANMSRFLRIIETFITIIELRGHSISPAWKKSKITVKEQEFEIKFIEKSNRKTISDGRWNRTTLVPSGTLTIRTRVSWNDKEWKDGYELLEEQLPKIVAYYEVKADDEIKRKIQWEIERKEEERLRKIEEERQARMKWEKDKKDILIADADKWSKLNNLRNFVSATKSVSDYSMSKEVKDWIKWAENVLKEEDFLLTGMDNYISKYEYSAPEKQNLPY